MRWRIEDFKGLNQADVDIRSGQLTVLTGVNSSGKSSVIQSLLLAAQSLYHEGSVVLNGPLVRLGDANDLVREESSTGAVRIRIAFDASDDDDDSDRHELRAILDLIPTDDRSSLVIRRIAIEGSGTDSIPFVVDQQNARSNDVRKVLAATEHMGPRRALHLKSLMGDGSRTLRTFALMQGLRATALVQLASPEQVTSRYAQAARTLFEGFERAESATSVDPSGLVRLGGAIREFVRLVGWADRRQDEAPSSLSEAISEASNGNPYVFERIWRGLSSDQRNELIEHAARARARRPRIVVPLNARTSPGRIWMGLLESQFDSRIEPSIRTLKAFNVALDSLADRVQYLGPLRDEPRVVWNHWNELARGLPVGTRGEYSATVLSRANSHSVEYVSPDGDLLAGSLAAGINDWLAYLNIGDTVAARIRGKLGVGLELVVGGHVRDLTSVGVGVSQALPLVVAMLSVPPGSLLIVEQPELHLHPAVQARLADFLTTARPDIAVIVETHSDAFITRIRRRAAEGTLNIGDVDITFVEPSLDGARTRVLGLTEFGDFSDWPDGFLGSAEEDTTAILRANVARIQGDSARA